MKTISVQALILIGLIASSLTAFANTLPQDCVVRLQNVASVIPGDDGTFSRPSDVQISKVILTKSGVGAANGVPYSNYSVAITITGANFGGSAVVQDVAGSCYILKINMKVPSP